MAPSTQEPQAVHGQVATPPDSPVQEFLSKDVKKDSHLIANAIRGLFSDNKKPAERLPEAIQDGESSDTAADTLKPKTPPNTPCNASSEPVTTSQLIGLLEAAFGNVGAKGDQEMPNVHLSPSGPSEGTTAFASNQRLLQLFSQLARSGQSVGHRPALALDTSESNVEGKHRAWDAETETDNSPKELYRCLAGPEPGPKEMGAVTLPNSLQIDSSSSVTREELKWLFTEALGIKAAQSNMDDKEPSSNEKIDNPEQSNDKPRVCASKVEYKTVNEVYVSNIRSSILLPVKT